MEATIRIDLLISNLSYELSQLTRVVKKSAVNEVYFTALNKLMVKHQHLGISKLLDLCSSKDYIKHQLQAAKLKLKLNQESHFHDKYLYFNLDSQYLPALCAWVFNDKQLATQLAKTASQQFQEKYEYEEDYTYGQFFFQFILNKFSMGSFVEDILQKLEDLDESTTARFIMIKALQKKNTDDFKKGFSAFIEEHDAFYKSIEGTLTVDKEKFTTEGSINSETLAWLKLANTVLSVDISQYFESNHLVPEALADLV